MLCMAMGVDVLVCTPFDFGDLNILCFPIVIMLIYKTGGTWRLGVTLSNMSLHSSDLLQGRRNRGQGMGGDRPILILQIYL